MRIFSRWTVILIIMSTEITLGASTFTERSLSFLTAVHKCSRRTCDRILGFRTTYPSHGEIKSRSVNSMICCRTPSTVRPKMIGRLEAFAMGFGESNMLELW